SGGEYTIVPLEPGAAWIHSGLSGFEEEGWVRKDSRFTLFDAALRAKGSVTLSVQARAGEGAVTLNLT
ncbi:MAG: hypothetical protein R6V76_02905, partial [Desulfobacterales bacterium]